MYRDDLAWIHHQGFSEFAESAAPYVVALLRKHAVTSVVELGCGTGILARALTEAGMSVQGCDASPAMIAIARETAPEAAFSVAPFTQVHVRCDAVVAMGEILNYGTLDDVRTLLTNVQARLFVFDIAERGAYPPHDERRSGGDDWSVIAIKESDGETLTRRVLTFRADGRRDEELHQLHLHDRSELRSLFREHGFRVQLRRSYGSRRLPPGHSVYVASRL
jgi:SAM-dependent methyltransferase